MKGKRVQHGNKTGGFTLVELMVVVAVIGLLMALAIPEFKDVMAISRDTKAQQVLDTVRKANMMRYAKTGKTLKSKEYNIGELSDKLDKYMDISQSLINDDNNLKIGGYKPGEGKDTIYGGSIKFYVAEDGLTITFGIVLDNDGNPVLVQDNIENDKPIILNLDYQVLNSSGQYWVNL